MGYYLLERGVVLTLLHWVFAHFAFDTYMLR